MVETVEIKSDVAELAIDDVVVIGALVVVVTSVVVTATDLEVVEVVGVVVVEENADVLDVLVVDALTATDELLVVVEDNVDDVLDVLVVEDFTVIDELVVVVLDPVVVDDTKLVVLVEGILTTDVEREELEVFKTEIEVTIGLVLYIFKRLPPPQYSKGLPLQVIEQPFWEVSLPPGANTEPVLITFPQ
ncbi:hypothetical protein MMC14_003966 [Varicellaria rhodocarpa]|nr:hypothetical protein [Varicellaria rhodocarpa]